MNSSSTSGFRRLCLFSLLAALTLASAASAQPTLNKTFLPDAIGPGSVSTLRFDITNADGVPVRGLAFTDNLPTGMTISSVPNLSSNCFGGSITASAGTSTLSFNDGGIGPNSTCSISVDVTSSTPGVHTNVSGDLTSDVGNGGNATDDLTVDTTLPGVSKSFSPNAVFFGGRSTLTITFDNTANAATALNLNITDNLPLGMEIASPAQASTDCTGGNLTAIAGDNVFSYAPLFSGDAQVAAGATCSINVDVIGNSFGTLANTTGELTSFSNFQTRSSGKASATLDVSVERISLDKSFTDDPAPPGGNVTLEFTVRNLDREQTATDITFTDDLDAVLSGLVATGLPLADPCGAGSSLTGSSVLTLTGGTIDPEGVCTFSVTLAIPSSAAAGSYSNTTGAISAFLGEELVVGDPAVAPLFVQAVPILTKTFIGDPVAAGETLILEFTITNTSATASATGITFSDFFVVELPSATSVPADDFCGTGSTATYIPLNPNGFDPASLTVTGANLAAGASCTFSLVLDVSAGATNGTYDNVTSEITATVDGAIVVGNPASDSFDIISAPFLRKEFIDDPVLSGETVTLQFTLFSSEEAPGDSTAITFQDDLAATLAGLAAIGLPADDICGVGSQIDGTTNLMFSGGTLAPGESCTFNVTLQVPATATAGSHTNTTSMVVATVLGVETAGPAASDDLLIGGLTLTKEFTDDPALPGGTVNLRFTIDNTSPVSDATDIQLFDNLTGVLSNLVGTGLPMSDVCGTGSTLAGANGDRLLILQSGSLAAGESCTFDVTLQVPSNAAPGTYTNLTTGFQATVEGATVQFTNAADVLTISSDFLLLTKEFIDDPVAPGEPVTLRFTVDNQLTNQDVTDITFTDDLEAVIAGLVNSSGTLNDVCGVGSQITGTSTLALTGGNLLAGTSCTFDVVLQLPASVDLGTFATNVTSEVTGTFGGGRTITGDPAIDMLAIDSLSLSKSFGSDAVAGSSVQLTFNVQNLSTAGAARRLSFMDDLDAMIVGLEATNLPTSDICGVGSVVSGTSLVDFQGGELLPGGSCTFTVDLLVPASTAAGSYLNVTSELFVSGIPEADPATDTLTVTTEADLSLTKTDSADPVEEGDTFTYTLTVQNNGPSDAAGVVVTDNLPSGLSLVSTTGCAEDPNGAPTCTIGEIAAGASAQATLDVTVGTRATGTLTNEATA